MKKEKPIGNQLVQYHANTEYVSQIAQAKELLTVIYINVAEEEDVDVFNKIEDHLDNLRHKLIRDNSNIATKFFKSQS